MPSQARAIGVGSGALSGVMQQPSSQYYLLVYGAYLDIEVWENQLIVRGIYAERPEFDSAGFKDKEFGGFGMIGTSLNDPKDFYRLTAFFGTGQMRGYIKDDLGNKQKYMINGAALQLEAAVRFINLETAISMQNFTGIVSESELESYVAWPFTFFFLRFGIYL